MEQKLLSRILHIIRTIIFPQNFDLTKFEKTEKEKCLILLIFLNKKCNVIKILILMSEDFSFFNFSMSETEGV